MFHMTLHWTDIMAVASTLITLGTLVTMFFKVYRPIASWKKAVDDRIEELERKRDADFERFKKIENQIQALLSASYALLDHAKTGNSTGTMDKAQQQLVANMIEHNTL
jgi:predicted negative regulator of RcsB-dependent stress response